MIFSLRTVTMCLLAAELERDLLSMDKEEVKLVAEIRAAAKHGNVKGAKILARAVVRLRGQRTKVLASAAQLRSVRTTIGVGTQGTPCLTATCMEPHLCRTSGGMHVFILFSPQIGFRLEEAG